MGCITIRFRIAVGSVRSLWGQLGSVWGCGVQAAKDVQVPTVGKLQRKAGFLEELGSQKLNSQQRQAVASVLVGAGGGTLPLALFGPPGTGKTVTLVECALQVTDTDPIKHCRVMSGFCDRS